MFDIGWAELLVIGSIALIVVGPKDLPRMMRVVGRYMAQARGMARDFQRSMEDAAREVDLAEMKEMKEVASQLNDLRTLPGKPVIGPKKPGITAATAGAGLAGSAGATTPRHEPPATKPPAETPRAAEPRNGTEG